ncbi:MAG: cation-transporting P-type ATPase [Nitrososphaerales archaeon]
MDKEAIAALPAQQVLEQLHTSLEGLTQSEAASHRETSGLNVLTKSKHTALDVLGRQLKSSLIYLLALASIVSFALGDLSDGIIIAIILVINAILGFVLEYRSEQAVEKLSTFISKQVSAKRDGRTVELDQAQLVPGDIILLEEGDVVSADCKLLVAEDLQANESQLTGESVPVTKTIQVGAAQHTASGDASLLFTGSVIEKGKATAVVYAIGDATELGKIASLSTRTHKVTQYEKSLKSFSSLLIRVVLVTLAVTFLAKLLLTRDLTHLPAFLLFIVALAIVAVPEALPVIATTVLSTGAFHLAKKQVVVKRLSSLEDFGNITLLCTDKTGTLTEGKMSIQRIVADDPLRLQQFAAATVKSTSEAGAARQDSFDAAFLAYIPPEIQEQARAYRQVQALPFDPETRRSGMVIEDTSAHTRYLVTLGAVETLLSLSDCQDPQRARYLAEATSDGEQGLRDFALAYRELPTSGPVDIPEYEQHLTFLGFVTLADPLRPTAKQTIERAKTLGVDVKILSGDSKEVAAYVGRQVGLGGEVHTGGELENMSPDELQQVVNNCDVFARVSPAQKFDIIGALRRDHVVGYQGDGINDAPALKLADVALAVDTATDVAKESADIVLLKQDLGVIVNGIQEGRTIFLNIDKYLKYTMVGNFGNLFALVVLYLLSLNLPMLPVQLLLTSLITDIPLITIASDRVDSKEAMRPEKYNTRSLMSISLVLGSCTALFELLYFELVSSRSLPSVQTSMFLFLTLLQFIVIVSIRNHSYFWRGVRPSLLLATAVALAFVGSFALPYIPFTARMFSFTPLPLQDLAIVVGLALVYLGVLDVIKVRYYRRADKNDSRSLDAQTSAQKK